jgi:polysaccharide pyruvyl transferase WcaK-like protein
MLARVYFDANGQEDNLGDSVLRRAYFEMLRPHGEIYLNGGGNSRGYLAAFPLRDGDQMFTSLDKWMQACRRPVIEQTTVMILNAGESFMRLTRRSFFQRWSTAVAVRLAGGVAIHCGHGLRAQAATWQRAMRTVLSTCQVVAWRDPVSRDWVGCGSVYPDWAFATGLDDNALLRSRQEPRDLLVVAVRGDRPPPSETWIETVAICAQRRGLRIQLVTQVRRDQPLALKLAERWGVDCLRWDDEHHPRHEVRVRAIYRRAALTISDRLHVLIIAMTEGSVPVGYAPHSVEKLNRSFMTLGIAQVAFSANDLGPNRALVSAAG